MQGGTELDGHDLEDAFTLFRDVQEHTVQAISTYLDLHPEKANRLHKSLINRLLEPFMWHTVICSATCYDNFFNQRCSPLAQPEIRVAAESMLSAMYEQSTPSLVKYGDWHLPFIDKQDHEEAARLVYTEPALGRQQPVEILKSVSVARCARVSYLTHDGQRSLLEDLKLYSRLVTASPMHASPLEHVATPVKEGDLTPGNFVGWGQYRHVIEHAISQKKEREEEETDGG